ncbi:unnamed protein product [Trichogramma brassicae]|uniref:Uncharacterized protein n=1 Tax=Trichogramma brassicae TaxID=86971 RepID=A0A6H5J4M6_9HYME|nr:unnamed protein product [Trichogramma brassicae]
MGHTNPSNKPKPLLAACLRSKITLIPDSPFCYIKIQKNDFFFLNSNFFNIRFPSFSLFLCLRDDYKSCASCFDRSVRATRRVKTGIGCERCDIVYMQRFRNEAWSTTADSVTGTTTTTTTSSKHPLLRTSVHRCGVLGSFSRALPPARLSRRYIYISTRITSTCNYDARTLVLHTYSCSAKICARALPRFKFIAEFNTRRLLQQKNDVSVVKSVMYTSSTSNSSASSRGNRSATTAGYDAPCTSRFLYSYIYGCAQQGKKMNFREKEKQVLDDILGPSSYDARIRPSGENGTARYLASVYVIHKVIVLILKDYQRKKHVAKVQLMKLSEIFENFMFFSFEYNRKCTESKSKTRNKRFEKCVLSLAVMSSRRVRLLLHANTSHYHIHTLQENIPFIQTYYFAQTATAPLQDSNFPKGYIFTARVRGEKKLERIAKSGARSQHPPAIFKTVCTHALQSAQRVSQVYMHNCTHIEKRGCKCGALE